MDAGSHGKLLANAVNLVRKTIDSKPTLPILDTVLLKAQTDNTLLVVGANSRTTFMVRLPGTVRQKGSIALPVKTLTEVLSNSAEVQHIDIKVDTSTWTAELWHGATTHIKGYRGVDYPDLPKPLTAFWATLDTATLRDAISRVAPSAATEHSRPILNTLNFTFNADGCVTLAGADGYRLAFERIPYTPMSEKALEGTVSVDRQTLVNLVSILGSLDTNTNANANADTILFGVENDILHFKTANLYMTTRVYDGTFPPYAAVLPKSWMTMYTLPQADLKRALKQARIFARDSSNSVKLISGDSTMFAASLLIKGNSSERGNNETHVEGTWNGERIEMACNVQFLLEAVEAIPTDQVIVQMTGPTQPMLLRPSDAAIEYTAVIMPMSATTKSEGKTAS